MKLFKKITYPEHLKNYIIFFIIYFLMNNIAAIGSDHKSYLFKSKQKYDEFEKIYTDNSIHYSEYDNLGSQLKTFFGEYSLESENSNYPDISLMKTSDAVREAYKSKLKDMVINETFYDVK